MNTIPEINRDIIVFMKFGSNLYGTNTPNSDIDYAGVYMPSLTDDLLLGRIKPSISFSTKKGDGKNTQDDIDNKIYSLHHFIDLSCKGETAALDMLHAPDEMILQTSGIWKDITRNREKFYTKNLGAFLGYARKQASKYGIKGSRLNAAKEFAELLRVYEYDTKMFEIWDKIKSNDHVVFIGPNENKVQQVEVCGRIFQDRYKTGYVLDIMEKIIKNYGHRAELAARNEGVDWKAVSHALRASYQIIEVLTEKTITFPLKEAKYIKEVKSGVLDYASEVSPKLESLISMVEELSSKSDLPEKVNKEYWDNFIVDNIVEYYGIF